ncbi:MAG: CBS domain-containing protein [Candidatus ainarchaeum sp.]|nr:CBS domain-containing protein [Candidatus ainarchaeum sp.]
MDVFEKLDSPAVLDAEEPLSAALGELARSDSCVVVTRDDAYVGIISDRSLEGVTSDPRSTKAGTVAERAPAVEFGAGLPELCKCFLSGAYKSLPVRRGKKIIGVVRRGDVLLALAEAGMLSGRVADFMSSPPISVEGKATVAQVLARMREKNVRRVLVFGGERLRGLVSVYDLKVSTLATKERMPFAVEKHSGEEAQVDSIMTPEEELVKIAPSAALSEAARRMAEKKVSALVVEKDGKAAGILSARDVLESLISEEQVPVHMSGLDTEERMVLDEISADVARELDKIRKSVALDYLALHFKKYKHKYSLRARLKTSRHGVIPASNSGFELRGTLHGVLAELGKLASKLKQNPIHEKPGKSEARKLGGLEQR